MFRYLRLLPAGAEDEEGPGGDQHPAGGHHTQVCTDIVPQQG